MILATGFGTALREQLGIRRRVIRDAHSLTLGFDIVPGAGSVAAATPLTYYGSVPEQRVDYLTVFPLRGTTA